MSRSVAPVERLDRVEENSAAQRIAIHGEPRLLGPRLGKDVQSLDPLVGMGRAMQQLGVRDADRQLAQLLQSLVA